MGPVFKFDPSYTQTSKGPMGTWEQVVDPKEDTEIKESSREVVPHFDNSIPSVVPVYKTNWTASWRLKVKKTTQELLLSDLSIVKSTVSKLMRSRKMFDTEIHLMWFSYIPQNLFQENMGISLHFTEALEEGRSLMAQNKVPAYLFIHHIFYPGHAIELYGSPIPWRLDIDLSRLPVTNNYVCGEIHVKVTGKHGPVPRMEEEKLSEMIAIVPIEQEIAGITLTRPRLPSSEMLRGYVKRGINSQDKVDKLIKLQSIGLDVEGMSLSGKLDSVLKNIPNSLLDKRGDKSARVEIANRVLTALGKGKKKKIV
ncbi:TPA_asm: protein 3 [Taxus virus 1]|uniref:Protein 3 n=1 Tax=Taxus virus 1 TaxID=2977994 RepID=A0A9N6YJK4_9RHAB|nr:TPA_asm: protein 3 [Taxus virus 1]